MRVFKDTQDFLNARDEEGQRRLCASVIQARLDGLVHMPEHIRAHRVIEHPETMAGRAGLFESHHPFPVVHHECRGQRPPD
jgi:hypothetical protein